MSILSEEGIKKELGKGILFYPFKKESIKSCNLCLTASEYIYSRVDKQVLKVQKDQQKKSFVKIKPKDRVLVWTNESVFLSDNFCGTLHTVTKLASQGLGHIGTRVNPKWLGVMCIPIHNFSEEEVTLYIKNPDEPIAYLMIHKLRFKSFHKDNINRGGRSDLIPKEGAEKIRIWLDDDKNLWRSQNKDDLKNKLKNSEEFKEIKVSWRDQFINILNSQTISAAIAAAIGAITTIVLTKIFK